MRNKRQIRKLCKLHMENSGRYYNVGTKQYIEHHLKQKFPVIKDLKIIEDLTPEHIEVKITVVLEFWAIFLDRAILEKSIEEFAAGIMIVGVKCKCDFHIKRIFKKKTIRRKDADKYLVRYSIFSCKWFAIKVHNILISDDDCLHDHPWKFISLILRGGYVEHTEKGSRIYHPGNILVRPAEFKHRLELHQPAWTLVITFKKTRTWGFHTPTGFIKWFNYTPNNNCK